MLAEKRSKRPYHKGNPCSHPMSWVIEFIDVGTWCLELGTWLELGLVWTVDITSEVRRIASPDRCRLLGDLDLASQGRPRRYSGEDLVDEASPA